MIRHSRSGSGWLPAIAAAFVVLLALAQPASAKGMGSESTGAQQAATVFLLNSGVEGAQCIDVASACPQDTIAAKHCLGGAAHCSTGLASAALAQAQLRQACVTWHGRPALMRLFNLYGIETPPPRG